MNEKSRNQGRKLKLDRERLRTIAAKELVAVAGGLPVHETPETETAATEVCCCQSTRKECSGMYWCP
jgi:hypothetical protein